MYNHRWLMIYALALCTCDPYVQQGGWLDRIVLHHKTKFIEDLQQIAPINIQASIEKKPVGYVDSPDWNIDSVARLLSLIGESESARSVRSSLRRMLAPTRRHYISKKNSYKYFPSLTKFELNDFYYDEESSNSVEYNDHEAYDSVVVVRNPVEARLPSARISINLLKDILEARAIAARKMPPAKSTPSPWTRPTENTDTNNKTGETTTGSDDNIPSGTTIDTANAGDPNAVTNSSTATNGTSNSTSGE